MSRTLLILQEIEINGAYPDGRIYAWTAKRTIEEFVTLQEAVDYLKVHVEDLPKDVQFFSGSASVLGAANQYLRLAKEGKL